MAPRLAQRLRDRMPSEGGGNWWTSLEARVGIQQASQAFDGATLSPRASHAVPSSVPGKLSGFSRTSSDAGSQDQNPKLVCHGMAPLPEPASNQGIQGSHLLLIAV